MTLEEELAAVREAKAEKERAAARRRDEREVEEFRLEQRFEQETGGKRGEKFEIIDFGNDAGFVVVVRGPAVLYQRLMASKIEAGDRSTFVLPQVGFPERDRFKEVANELLGIWDACADELVVLHKARKSKLAGKA